MIGLGSDKNIHFTIFWTTKQRYKLSAWCWSDYEARWYWLLVPPPPLPPLQQTDLSDNEMKSRVDFPEQHKSVMDLSEEGGWIITLRKHFICCERLLLCLAPRPLPWQSICNIRDVHCKTGYVKRGCKHYLEWIGVLKKYDVINIQMHFILLVLPQMYLYFWFYWFCHFLVRS